MKNNKSNKEKHLKLGDDDLRARENSVMGLIIAYMQSSPINQQDLAKESLRGRFLPFALGRDHPLFQEIAISCANDCESWAKTIREYAGLNVRSDVPLDNPGVNTEVREHQPTEEFNEGEDYEDNDEYDEEEDLEAEARKKARLERRSNSGF